MSILVLDTPRHESTMAGAFICLPKVILHGLIRDIVVIMPEKTGEKTHEENNNESWKMHLLLNMMRKVIDWIPVSKFSLAN